MLIKSAHWAFYWPKYAYMDLTDVWAVNHLVRGTFRLTFCASNRL